MFYNVSAATQHPLSSSSVQPSTSPADISPPCALVDLDEELQCQTDTIEGEESRCRLSCTIQALDLAGIDRHPPRNSAADRSILGYRASPQSRPRSPFLPPLRISSSSTSNRMACSLPVFLKAADGLPILSYDAGERSFLGWKFDTTRQNSDSPSLYQLHLRTTSRVHHCVVSDVLFFCNKNLDTRALGCNSTSRAEYASGMWRESCQRHSRSQYQTFAGSSRLPHDLDRMRLWTDRTYPILLYSK